MINNFCFFNVNAGRRNIHHTQPYWQYDMFYLEELEDDVDCPVEFRFSKQEIYDLVNVLELPEVSSCYNGTVVDSVEALCICLKRFAYRRRYVDLIPGLGSPVSHLCTVLNLVTDQIYERFSHLLTSLEQPSLSQENLQHYADAIHNKGAALDNCWGFLDGTVRSICRPGRNQRPMYNGHKRVQLVSPSSFNQSLPLMDCLQTCMVLLWEGDMIVGC